MLSLRFESLFSSYPSSAASACPRATGVDRSAHSQPAGCRNFCQKGMVRSECCAPAAAEARSRLDIPKRIRSTTG